MSERQNGGNGIEKSVNEQGPGGDREFGQMTAGEKVAAYKVLEETCAQEGKEVARLEAEVARLNAKMATMSAAGSSSTATSRVSSDGLPKSALAERGLDAELTSKRQIGSKKEAESEAEDTDEKPDDQAHDADDEEKTKDDGDGVARGRAEAQDSQLNRNDVFRFAQRIERTQKTDLHCHFMLAGNEKAWRDGVGAKPFQGRSGKEFKLHLLKTLVKNAHETIINELYDSVPSAQGTIPESDAKNSGVWDLIDQLCNSSNQKKHDLNLVRRGDMTGALKALEKNAKTIWNNFDECPDTVEFEKRFEKLLQYVGDWETFLAFKKHNLFQLFGGGWETGNMALMFGENDSFFDLLKTVDEEGKHEDDQDSAKQFASFRALTTLTTVLMQMDGFNVAKLLESILASYASNGVRHVRFSGALLIYTLLQDSGVSQLGWDFLVSIPRSRTLKKNNEAIGGCLEDVRRFYKTATPKASVVKMMRGTLERADAGLIAGFDFVGFEKEGICVPFACDSWPTEIKKSGLEVRLHFGEIFDEEMLPHARGVFGALAVLQTAGVSCAIGHGIYALKYAKRLADAGFAKLDTLTRILQSCTRVEVCPLSNRWLSLGSTYPLLGDLISDMKAVDLNLVVGSDDPLLFSGTYAFEEWSMFAGLLKRDMPALLPNFLFLRFCCEVEEPILMAMAEKSNNAISYPVSGSGEVWSSSAYIPLRHNIPHVVSFSVEKPLVGTYKLVLDIDENEGFVVAQLYARGGLLSIATFASTCEWKSSLSGGGLEFELRLECTALLGCTVKSISLHRCSEGE